MAETGNTTVKKAAEKRSGRDNARWIIGLLILSVGVFATLSVLSYYLDWKHDSSVLNSVETDNPRADKTIDNMCGTLGAHIGDWLVGQSFGVFGIMLPIIAILIGIRTIRRKPMLFNHSVLSSLLILILGSLTLELAFGSNSGTFGSGWGGAFGIAVAEFLRGTIGLAGSALLLVVSWILTGVFINSNFINTVNHAGTAVVGRGEEIVDKLRVALERRHRSDADDKAASADADAADAVGTDIAADDVSDANARVERDAAESMVSPIKYGTAETGAAETEPAAVVVENETAADEPVPAVRTERRPRPEIKVDEYGFIEVDLSELRAAESAAAAAGAAETATAADVAVGGAVSDDVRTGGTESDLRVKTIVVEEHTEALANEKQIEKRLYDPLKDVHNYKRPSVELLEEHLSTSKVTDEEITFNKRKIEETLANFGIPIREMKATIGPTVTLYEIVQEQGVKISRIQGLEDDIAQSLKALGIRIIAPMPGRGTIGIEVPNQNKEIVSMRSAVQSRRFQQFEGELPVVIGRTIQNENYVFDLAKMPHLLVAGATGQGKSVGLNAIITSLLYRKHPAQLKFVLIDPKMVEFSLYAKLEKHFLAKMQSEDDAIVTDPKKAVYTLNALCLEMDNRLDLCRKAGARNIVEYNEKFVNCKLNPENGHRYLPYIVVVVDEFADLIMTAREVEGPVMRLAQKARAIGIHLIIATQRPDVKVITGGIKANFPARIAFRVMQMIDSRTIIDQPGANQLIGRGDMLFSKDGNLTRIQCALVDTPEVEKIVDYISKQNGYPSAYALPDYEEAGSGDSGLGSDLGGGAPVKYDTLFAEIARDAVTGGQISTSYIQRNYEVGFNRAGRIMTQLERAGIVGPQVGAKPREIKFYDLPSLEAKLQDLGVQ